MCNLAEVHQDSILNLATVANQSTISYYNIASQIRTFANLAVTADKTGANNNCPMLYNSPLPNIHTTLILHIYTAFNPIFFKQIRVTICLTLIIFYIALFDELLDQLVCMAKQLPWMIVGLFYFLQQEFCDMRIVVIFDWLFQGCVVDDWVNLAGLEEFSVEIGLF